jgi:hypothetical protein
MGAVMGSAGAAESPDIRGLPHLGAQISAHQCASGLISGDSDTGRRQR